MKLPVIYVEEETPVVAPTIALQERASFPTADWLEQARAAQMNWALMSVEGRLGWLKKLRHLLAADGVEIAENESRQTGRPVEEILSAQVIPLCDACLFLERNAKKLLSPRPVKWPGKPAWLFGTAAEVLREPHGVVLIISPSNYRLFLPGVMIIQALVAGNAVLLKPGPGGTPLARMLRGLCERAGLDTHLFQILPEGAEAAQESISLGVDKVVFTGRAETGRKVMQHAATHLTPLTLELSGCDAVIVRKDADIDLVVRALLFGLRLNDSQTCIAPRRVFVVRARMKELTQKLRDALAGVPPRTVHDEEIAQFVQQAHLGGAGFLHGSVSDTGVLRLPIIVSNAHPSMRLLRSDVFASILSIVEVRDDAEAIEASEQCPFGLGASIFSRDLVGARSLAKQLSVGCVVINDMIVPTADPRISFGGRKESGFGVTRGAEGLLEMTVGKVILHRKFQQHPHLDSHPADRVVMQSYLQAVHSSSRGVRLQGWWDLAKALALRMRSQK